MADMTPTTEDLARDAVADMELVFPYSIFSCEKGLLSGVAHAWIRRAVAAEAEVARLKQAIADLRTHYEDEPDYCE